MNQLIEQWIAWAWIIMALVLAVGEIVTAGFFLLCFALGALAASVMAFLGYGLIAQLTAFVAVSAAAVLLVRPLAVRISNRDTYLVGIDRVIGRTAVVVETIDPAAGRGVVRVGSERWSATSVDGTPIPVGAQVEVLRVEGVHLQVRIATSVQ